VLWGGEEIFWYGAEQIEGMHRDALMNPILDELVREGRIRITTSKDGDLVSLTGK